MDKLKVAGSVTAAAGLTALGALIMPSAKPPPTMLMPLRPLAMPPVSLAGYKPPVPNHPRATTGEYDPKTTPTIILPVSPEVLMHMAAEKEPAKYPTLIDFRMVDKSKWQEPLSFVIKNEKGQVENHCCLLRTAAGERFYLVSKEPLPPDTCLIFGNFKHKGDSAVALNLFEITASVGLDTMQSKSAGPHHLIHNYYWEKR